MKKIAITLIAIGLVGCTVSLVMVKNSDNTDISIPIETEVNSHSGVDIKFNKSKDTINETKDINN